MQVVVIGVLLVLAMAGMGGSYKLGNDHATLARDAHWRSAIDTANKEKSDALEMIKLGLNSSDRIASDKLAALEAAIKAKDDELSNVADKIPLSQACQACRIPAARIDGVRK
jgi:hypothetical protein